MNDLDQQTKQLGLLEATEVIVNASGLIEYFQKEKGETGRARIENLRELISAAGEFNMDALSAEEKEILVQVSNPQNQIITEQTSHGEYYTTDAQSNIAYTSRLTVPFDQTKKNFCL